MRAPNSHGRRGLRANDAAALHQHADSRDEPQQAFHVAGVVIHALPSALESVAHDIALIAGARIHGSSPAGKLVVTLEGAATGVIVSALESIRCLRGVIDASLVYQHGDDDADAGREQAQGDFR
jgi:nitrate reductase NapD